MPAIVQIKIENSTVNNNNNGINKNKSTMDPYDSKIAYTKEVLAYLTLEALHNFIPIAKQFVSLKTELDEAEKQINCLRQLANVMDVGSQKSELQGRIYVEEKEYKRKNELLGQIKSQFSEDENYVINSDILDYVLHKLLPLKRIEKNKNESLCTYFYRCAKYLKSINRYDADLTKFKDNEYIQKVILDAHMCKYMEVCKCEDKIFNERKIKSVYPSYDRDADFFDRSPWSTGYGSSNLDSIFKKCKNGYRSRDLKLGSKIIHFEIPYIGHRDVFSIDSVECLCGLPVSSVCTIL